MAANLTILSALTLAAFGKAAPPTLSGVDSRGGWWPIIRESVAGAWQSNVTVEIANVLTYSPVYACLRIIASDIAKLRPKLVRLQDTGVWVETENPAFSPVLRKPNRYQTSIEFFEHWVLQKLIHGNAYVLLQRDGRGVVAAMYVLDSTRVRPLVAPDGAIYYQLHSDALSGIPDGVMVPASELIHDKMATLYHPLVGISPISACGVAAVEALRIQENSTVFFGNGSKPGGVLTAPGHISQETADRVKAYWDTNFTGENIGKVAVLGDGLKYEGMAATAVESQLIEQLRWTAEDVCQAFGVPRHKVGVGPDPTWQNIEALNLQYYQQCLQEKIEKIELLLDLALGLAPSKIDGVRYGVEFEVDNLMRMDTSGRVNAAKTGVDSGALSPDEARFRYFDLGPVPGGGTPYMQQQNYSLAALAERDRDRPFAKPAPAASVAAPAAPRGEDEAEAEARWVRLLHQKAAEVGLAA